MKCQDAEREILDKRNSADLPVPVAAHLSECRPCASLLHELAEIDHFFDSAAMIDPSPFLWTRIESRISPAERFGSLFPFRLTAPAWMALAALIFFSAFITSFQNPILPGPPSPMAQELGLPPSTDGSSNPFLLAQAGPTDDKNPFLEAMFPLEDNPFGAAKAP